MKFGLCLTLNTLFNPVDVVLPSLLHYTIEALVLIVN